MNAKVDDPKLLAAAEAIASEEAVDWDALTCSCDAHVVLGLRSIQTLVKRFSIRDPQWPQPGDCWNHLELLEQIGAGSDSIVFKAYDRLLNRCVALKLRSSRASSLASDLAEGQRMARVDHPNVLKVHGVAEQNGLLGLWSELIDGESLSRWLEEGKRLGSAELISIGSELCAALAAIHKAGLIHGDVKPGNVIRARNGRFVLVDFGACVYVSEVDKICGTPLYCAPEVLMGGKPSVASDIYSLGALLYRLASGAPPVNAKSFPDLVAAHRQNCRSKLLDARPDLPTALLSAIENAIDNEPQRRPASAGHMGSQLADCLPSTTKSSFRWTRLGVAAALLLSIGITVITIFRGPVIPSDHVRFVRTSDAHESALIDGGTIMPGETFALDVTPSEATFAYVMDEDDKGESFQLFPLPHSQVKNPLEGGKKYRLPGATNGDPLDWQITSRGGTDRLYVLLSARPIPDLEEGRKLSLATREGSVDHMDALASVLTRGAGGTVTRKLGPSSFSKLESWVQALMKQDPTLRVEQISLKNP
jgi:serine/threonine protein kinase